MGLISWGDERWAPNLKPDGISPFGEMSNCFTIINNVATLHVPLNFLLIWKLYKWSKWDDQTILFCVVLNLGRCMTVWELVTGNLYNPTSTFLWANIEASRHPILAQNLLSQHQIFAKLYSLKSFLLFVLLKHWAPSGWIMCKFWWCVYFIIFMSCWKQIRMMHWISKSFMRVTP